MAQFFTIARMSFPLHLKYVALMTFQTLLLEVLLSSQNSIAYRTVLHCTCFLYSSSIPVVARIPGIVFMGLSAPRIIAWMLTKTESRVDLLGCHRSCGAPSCVLRRETDYSKSFRIVAQPGEVSNLTFSIQMDIWIKWDPTSAPTG